jgi:ABC-type glycerol-3-phosphate transport system substrate-binding protein
MTHPQSVSRRVFLKTAGVTGVGLFLAACAAPGGAPSPGAEAGDSPGQEPITLRLHMRAGGETSEPPIYVTRPEEFTEETGIQVQLEPTPGDEYWAKIETLAASNTLGDNMFTTEANWQHTRAAHFGILQDIDDFMEADNIDRGEWLEGVLDTCVYNGRIYGLPKTAHPAHCFIFINHDLFEAAGIPIPETYGNTWDDVRQWAGMLAEGDPERRDVYGYHMPTENIQMFINGVRTFGGDIISEDGTEALATEDGYKGFVRYAHDLYNVDQVMPHSTELGTGGILGLFAANRLGMMGTARSAYSQVNEAVGPMDGDPAFPWSVIAMPEGPNFQGWGLSLNTHAGTSQSEHKYESFLLTYALADARFAYLVANDIGFLVGRTNELEEIGPAADDPFVVLQYEQHARGTPYRIGQNFRGIEFQSALMNSVDEVFLNLREPDDAFFEELDEILDDILARPL